MKEFVFLIALAALTVAIDIPLSKKIGLLAFPPYYDGVHYTVEAKDAALHLGIWKQHPVHFAFMILNNRFPFWKALLAFSFSLFGVGEWQAYTARFWPALVLLSTVFWVVRRHAGSMSAFVAAIFTAVLPTLSVNLHSVAFGSAVLPRGYLADLRPDLLFAAFVTLSVTFLIESVHAFDKRTALAAGAAAALAILTKASTTPVVGLACGLATVYVLYINRGDFRKTLRTMTWALLPFTILSLPWMLSGGLRQTIDYFRQTFTSLRPRYSNQHPTFRSEFTYYGEWLVAHMGWGAVLLAAISPLLLFFSSRKARPAPASVHQQSMYLLIAFALYVSISANPVKNYFFCLPCYLILWIYCWTSQATFIASLGAAKSRVAWSFVSASILTIAVIGILGTRNFYAWKGHEAEEGQHDRLVMQQIAADLSQILSKGDSFVPMQAYGNPHTLFFYMPDRPEGYPRYPFLVAGPASSVQEFVLQSVEPAKAVLIFANGNMESAFREYTPEAEYPYHRAVAAWVRRPGSSHHLWKTYKLYQDPGKGDAAVELYVRTDSHGSAVP